VIQAFEAVKPTRTHKARRENRSANQLSQNGAVSLREQARWLDNNNDLVIGILDKLEERVIGSEGIIVDPHPVLKNGNIAKKFASQIRSAWAEWSVSPDVTGEPAPCWSAFYSEAGCVTARCLPSLSVVMPPGCHPLPGSVSGLKRLRPITFQCRTTKLMG
jgi:capsid protein